MDEGTIGSLLPSFFLLDYNQMGSLLSGSSFVCAAHYSLLIWFLCSAIQRGAGSTPVESKESQEYADLSRRTVQSVHPVLECLMETWVRIRSLD